MARPPVVPVITHRSPTISPTTRFHQPSSPALTHLSAITPGAAAQQLRNPVAIPLPPSTTSHSQSTGSRPRETPRQAPGHGGVPPTDLSPPQYSSPPSSSSRSGVSSDPSSGGSSTLFSSDYLFLENQSSSRSSTHSVSNSHARMPSTPVNHTGSFSLSSPFSLLSRPSRDNAHSIREPTPIRSVTKTQPAIHNSATRPPITPRVPSHVHFPGGYAPSARLYHVPVHQNPVSVSALPPSTKEIPVLTGRENWTAWNNGVTLLITSLGLYGHIADDWQTHPNALTDPLLLPSYPPDLLPNYTDQDLALHTRWWAQDNQVLWVLTSRLSTTVLSSIPTALPTAGQRRSSREIYTHLRSLYSIGDYHSAMLVEQKLRSLRVRVAGTSGGVSLSEYISTWRASYIQLYEAGYPLPHRQVLQLLVCGLPTNSLAFMQVRTSVFLQLRNSDDNALPSFDEILDTIRIVGDAQHMSTTLHRPVPKSPSTRSRHHSTNPAPPPTGSATSVRPTCTTCQGSHLTENCFQPGGAMEGRKDKVLANRRSRTPVMAHVAEVDTGPGLSDEIDTFEVEQQSPVVQQFAALSLARPTSAQSIEFSSYFPCPMPNIALAAPLDWVLLALSISNYNTALDSGCSIHLIKDRSLFWTYNEQERVMVGTANCGVMATCARGSVRIRLPLTGNDGRTIHITWILKDCLHAPEVPFNLISVGQIVEAGVACRFEPGDGTPYTRVCFPDKGQLGGRHIDAMIKHRISFLHLNFLPPPTSSSPSHIACPALPISNLTPELWHRCLGHPGHDTTRTVLTKHLQKGTDWAGDSQLQFCVACILGKAPQTPYVTNKHRAALPCELIHMDTCGPFPVVTSTQAKYYLAILDDCTNMGGIGLMTARNNASAIWRRTTAKWETATDTKIKAIRMDGAAEFVGGDLRKLLEERGIAIQQTAPYAHQQNGKIERYIRTISDTAAALMADAGLPPSFWGWAVLAAVYLRNRIPTKTLPAGTSPYEQMQRVKPDLTLLRVWGCRCFAYLPDELRGKGSPLRYEGIFVGYEEDCLGWNVMDLQGKVRFTQDVIFVEDERGHLTSPRNRKPSTPAPKASTTNAPLHIPSSRVLRSQAKTTPVVHTSLVTHRPDPTAPIAPLSCLSEVVRNVHNLSHTFIHPLQTFDSLSLFADLNNIDSFVNTCKSDNVVHDVFSLSDFIPDDNLPSLHHSFLSHSQFPYRFCIADYNPDKPPKSYQEAMARPDRDIWKAAMQREYDSLHKRGAFERTTPIPHGYKAIGVVWRFSFKYHPDSSIRRGEEKARLVAQGFHQRYGINYIHTYAPVCKPSSVKLILAHAAHNDLEIMSFDVKTAFLHAKLSYSIYVKQIPGFPEADSNTVLRLLVALYGLRQSAHEFYQYFMKLLLRIGLSRCEVDQSVFVGYWNSPPHPSIPALPNSSRLFLIIPIHVDDGLVVTNSIPLYNWFIQQLLPDLEVIDMGPVSMYLGCRITRDRPRRKLWMSQKPMIYDLLQAWDMLECTLTKVPLAYPLHKLLPVPHNSLSHIPDGNIKTDFQRIVGSLIYIAISTRPDIAYAAMALGQYNANPTRAHLLAAKGVMRYLAGTMDWGLEYAVDEAVTPNSVVPYIQGCVLSDADWASDESNRKSISGYCFFYQGCLVSWSASKQRIVASSSTEAEYYSLSHALREAIWLRLFLTSLSLPVPTPFPMLGDNRSTLCIANSDGISNRTKHIDVRYHLIREKIADGTFETQWVPTGDMTADIFTKPLPFPIFSKHRSSLGVIRIP